MAKRKEDLVDCVCDHCGVTAQCPESVPAPKGWWYIESETVEGAVTACSEDCRDSLGWQRA